MKLTTKQQAFVDQYLICRNGAEAARRAGYAELSARQIATENLTKPYIQAALAEKEADLARNMEISKATVVEELRAAIEVAQDKLDVGSMIRGWVEIAKMLGHYAPEIIKVAVSAENAALRAKYEAMSDEELIAIAEGR